jgi:ABC-2 type transport system permease protein
MKVARLVWAGFVFNVKQLTANLFFVMTSVIQPVIFASIAFFLFQAGAREGTLLYVALGAGLMGVWSTVLFASGGVLQWQRWQGTLELAIAAPTPFVQVLAPMTLANAAVGLYAVGATLVWGRLFFGVPLSLEHPFLFVVALVATVLSLGMLGLVMAASFIRYRHANALSNLESAPSARRRSGARRRASATTPGRRSRSASGWPPSTSSSARCSCAGSRTSRGARRRSR